MELLRIDDEFRTIIPPLTKEEYANLEESLRHEGCRDAILVWDDVIVDGHNRYEICRKWNIPYRVIRLKFTSREAAISWICLNQLSRRNLTHEAYKYLIGKRYDAEKAACSMRNKTGRNQYTPATAENPSIQEKNAALWTSRRLAGEYNLTHATVERYGEYSRSLDKIEKEKPGMLPSLLSGRCRISQQNLTALSELPGEKMNSILDSILENSTDRQMIPMNITDREIAPVRKERINRKRSQLETKIKEMPEYNPDAEMNGLTITIPTWIDMITRLTGVHVRYASEEAKRNMRQALTELQQAITGLQQAINEPQQETEGGR